MQGCQTSPLSPNSILWFGPHKGKRIREVPRDYLVNLAEQPVGYCPRRKRLKVFLCKYLETAR